MKDMSPVFLEHVRQFTVGFARPNGVPSAALGTGVLIKTPGFMAILTCAHVVRLLETIGEVGLANFTRGMVGQAATLDMRSTPSITIGTEPWDGPDIGLILVPPEKAGGLEARFTALNIQKNFEKYGNPEPSAGFADVVFGLVEQFSGKPVSEKGVVTVGLTGVLTPGRIVEKDDETITLECLEQNIPDLPRSFGGTSGGGLWRLYIRNPEDEKPDIIEFRLRGIASREDLSTRPPRIICQSLRKIAIILQEGARQFPH
jgi:hypothetical protein